MQRNRQNQDQQIAIEEVQQSTVEASLEPVPMDERAYALAQLANVSLFCSADEFKRLFRRMHVLIEDECPRPMPQAWVDPTNGPVNDPLDDDDEFPDTKAFDEVDDIEMPVPLPQRIPQYH